MAQQLTPQELQELVKLYEKINGLTKAAAQSQAQQAESMGTARDELERLSDIWNDFVNDLSNTEKQFAKLTDQIKGQRSGIIQAAASYDKLRGIAAKINDIQDRTTKTSFKELNSLKEKAASERKRLETAKSLLEDQLRTSQLGTKEYYKTSLTLGKVNQTLRDQEGHFEAINESIEREEKKLRDIQNSLGISGALLKGISKIPILGNLPGMSEVLGEVEEEIVRIRDEEGRLVSRSEALGMTLKKVGPIIKSSLTDPLAIGLFIFNQFKEAFKAIDSGAGELAKNMNISYNEALSFREELSIIARQSDSIFVTTKALGETYSAITNALGANIKISTEELELFTKLREQAGFTNEEIVSLSKLTALTGKSAKEVSSNFLGSAKALSIQKGLSINVKQLLKETANVSNSIKLSLGGSEESLAKAMVSAKGLGTSLEKVDQIAGSLLQFEESISSELEAELLIGKELNLETARYAALTGDIATVAEEIRKQIGGSAEFSRMNRIQQEAFAKAVGMSREELANTLVEQESLSRLGRALTDEEKRAYEFAKQKYGEEEAARMVGEGQLDNLMQQQSVQERFNASVEKLKDIFVSIADGPIGTILSAFATLLSNTHLMKGLLAGLGVALIPIAYSLGAAAVAAISTMSALTLGIGAVAIAAGIITAVASMKSATETAKPTYLKDGMINPEGGLVVSGKRGTYSLDKNDTVIAGTDLNKTSDRSSVSMQPVIDRLVAVENVLIQILNKDTNVYMDSTKVGTALNIGTVQIQ